MWVITIRVIHVHCPVVGRMVGIFSKKNWHGYKNRSIVYKHGDEGLGGGPIERLGRENPANLASSWATWLLSLLLQWSISICEWVGPSGHRRSDRPHLSVPLGWPTFNFLGWPNPGRGMVFFLSRRVFCSFSISIFLLKLYQFIYLLIFKKNYYIFWKSTKFLNCWWILKDY